MKFCPNCSAPLDDDAVYCTECGKSLADDFSSNNSSYNSTESTQGYEHTIPTGSSEGNYTENNGYSNNNSNYSYNNQYNAPPAKNPGTPWIIVSVVSFFCCSGFLAIPGLILGILSSSSFTAGNMEDAQNKAKTAMWLIIGAAVISIIITIILIASGILFTFEETNFY